MTRSFRSLLAALLSLTVLAAGACSDEPDDLEGDLAAALSATLEDSFSFRFSVDADRDALAALGEDAVAAAGFLGSFAFAGERTEQGAAFRLQVFGQDALDVRSGAGDRTFVRLGLADVPAVPPELTDPATMLPALRQLGIGQDAELAAATLLKGDWLEVVGPLDLARLSRAIGGDPAAEDGGAAFDGDLEAQVRRFVEVVEHTEADGRRTFRIQLRLRDLAAAGAEATAAAEGDAPADLDDLGSIPEVVPGSVLVRDGRVDRIRLDVASLTTDDDAPPGRVELQLDVEDHGSASLPPWPTPARTIDAEQLLDAIATIAAFVVG